MLLEGKTISLIRKGNNNLSGVRVDCSKYGLPLSSSLFALYLRLLSFYRPTIRNSSRITQTKFIFKQNNCLSRILNSFFLMPQRNSLVPTDHSRDKYPCL